MAEEKRQFPLGVRFKPYVDELVEHYLLPKLEGRQHECNDAVIEANVYQWHPDTLTELYKQRGETAWYFLSPRGRKYQNGDRPSRTTEDNRGRWKASTGKVESAHAVGDDDVRYCDSVLAYFEFEGSITNERKTKWLMQELTVPHYEIKLDEDDNGNNNMLDEYVMCKIYVSPRCRESGSGGAAESSSSNAVREGRGSSSQPTPAANAQGTPQQSVKSLDKRPMKEQSCRPALAGKRPCQPREPRGPLPGCNNTGSIPIPVPQRAQFDHNGIGAWRPVAWSGQGGQQPCFPVSPMARPPATVFPQATFGRPMIPRPPRGQAFRPPAGMRPPPLPPQQQQQLEHRVHQQLLASVWEQPDRYLNHNARTVGPPGNAAYAPEQQRPMASMQQPCFDGANANVQAEALATPSAPHGCDLLGDGQYSAGSVLPAVSPSGGVMVVASSSAVPAASGGAEKEWDSTGDLFDDMQAFMALTNLDMPQDVIPSEDGFPALEPPRWSGEISMT